MGTKYTDAYFDSSLHGHHSVKIDARKTFADWLTLAPESREPQTMKELARELNVAYSTLKLWKNDVRFVAEVANRLGRHIDIEMVPDVIRTLHKQAVDKENPRSVQAAKELLGFLKWNIERTEALNAPDITKLEDSELRELMLSALDELETRDPAKA